MRFLPVFLDISSGIVALIGGGAAAKSKLRLLRSAGAHVRWYAGDVDVAEEVLLASTPPGHLEVALSIRCRPTSPNSWRWSRRPAARSMSKSPRAPAPATS